MNHLNVMLLLGLLSLPLLTHAQSVEEVVRTQFAGTPLIDIARCESKFTQFNSEGTALRGGYGSKMIGVFQIYEDIHAEYAKGLGMDIYTLEGNLAYARYLFDRKGTKPWLSSMPCWGKEVDSPDAVAGAPMDSLTLNFSMGMEHPQILVLQELLNAKGYIVAEEGPGSPGQETQKFGAFTRAAVRKFQCDQKIACDGDEHSTGYGFVGLQTRTALLSAPIAATSSESDPTQTPVASTYTPEQQKQIAALQAQILELTALLNSLLAQR